MATTIQHIQERARGDEGIVDALAACRRAGFVLHDGKEGVLLQDDVVTIHRGDRQAWQVTSPREFRHFGRGLELGIEIGAQQMDVVHQELAAGTDDGNYAPDDWVGYINEYVTEGARPGGFLYAVLTDQLFGAVTRADNRSLRHLRGILWFVNHYTPAACRGSQATVEKWIALTREERADQLRGWRRQDTHPRAEQEQ